MSDDKSADTSTSLFSNLLFSNRWRSPVWRYHVSVFRNSGSFLQNRRSRRQFGAHGERGFHLALDLCGQFLPGIIPLRRRSPHEVVQITRHFMQQTYLGSLDHGVERLGIGRCGQTLSTLLPSVIEHRCNLVSFSLAY